ncbi:MAG: RNA recognition motif-containing protein [Thermoproteota archaeon]|jgi:RNA recognition motif-containing protein
MRNENTVTKKKPSKRSTSQRKFAEQSFADKDKNKNKNDKPKVDVRAERKLGYYQKDEEVTTVYIGNLKFQKKEQDIKEMFEFFGAVKYVKTVIDNETGYSKGYAFVQMTNENKAKLAVETLNGKLMDGRTLKVSIAQERAFFHTAKPKYVEEEEETSSVDKTKGAPAPKSFRKRRPKGLKVLFNYLES